jgi:hypothetical protein
MVETVMDVQTGLEEHCGLMVAELCSLCNLPHPAFWRRVCQFTERLLFLDLDVPIGVVLGNVMVFGHHMGENKASGQEKNRESRQFAKPALALSRHNNLLFV